MPPIVFPRAISLRDPFELLGNVFKGDADQNHVTLGPQLALVLAASPVSLVAIPNPDTPLGATQLVVEVAGRTFDPMPVTVVSLQITGPGKALGAGEQGVLSVRVSGSAEPLPVEIRNFSPGIVQLKTASAGTSVQRATTSGGNANTARIELLGVAPGDYAVSARIVSPMSGSPSLENARLKLLAAQHIADAKWRERIGSVVQRIEQEPPDATRIRQEIERLMDAKPQRPVADLLQMAWEALRYV